MEACERSLIASPPFLPVLSVSPLSFLHLQPGARQGGRGSVDQTPGCRQARFSPEGESRVSLPSWRTFASSVSSMPGCWMNARAQRALIESFAVSVAALMRLLLERHGTASCSAGADRSKSATGNGCPPRKTAEAVNRGRGLRSAPLSKGVDGHNPKWCTAAIAVRVFRSKR